MVDSSGPLMLMFVLGIAVYAVGIYIGYLIIKAAVRNGAIEAYLRLRREGIYPPN